MSTASENTASDSKSSSTYDSASTAGLVSPSASAVSQGGNGDQSGVISDIATEVDGDPESAWFWKTLLQEAERDAIDSAKAEIDSMMGLYVTKRKKRLLQPGERMPKRIHELSEADRQEMVDLHFKHTLENFASMVSSYTGFQDTDIDGPRNKKMVGISGTAFNTLASQRLTNDYATTMAEADGRGERPPTGICSFSHVEADLLSTAARKHLPAVRLLAAFTSRAPTTKDGFEEFTSRFPEKLHPFLQSAREMVRTEDVRPWSVGTGKIFTDYNTDGTIKHQYKSAMRKEANFPLFGLPPLHQDNSESSYITDVTQQITSNVPGTIEPDIRNSTLQRQRERRRAAAHTWDRDSDDKDTQSKDTASASSRLSVSTGDLQEGSDPRISTLPYSDMRVKTLPKRTEQATEATTRAPPTTRPTTVADSSASDDSSSEDDRSASSRPIVSRGRRSHVPTAEERHDQDSKFREIFGKGKGKSDGTISHGAPPASLASGMSHAQAVR